MDNLTESSSSICVINKGYLYTIIPMLKYNAKSSGLIKSLNKIATLGLKTAVALESPVRDLA